jgi:thiamine-phosphate pyrophosphorylase
MKTTRFVKSRMVSGLYVIIDPEVLTDRNPLTVTHQVLHGGVTAIQLRDKMSDQSTQIHMARKMRKLCETHDSVLIMNDSPYVAVEAQSHGLHLGQNDCSIATARSILNDNQFIGTSNATLEEAVSSEKQGSDYIAVGAVFSTHSKTATRSVSLSLLSEIKKTVNVPVVAIGGISHENVHLLKASRIDGICVIGAVCHADNPKESSRDLLKAFQSV